jgi:hypothetical protein
MPAMNRKGLLGEPADPATEAEIERKRLRSEIQDTGYRVDIESRALDDGQIRRIRVLFQGYVDLRAQREERIAVNESGKIRYAEKAPIRQRSVLPLFPSSCHAPKFPMSIGFA